MLFMGINLENKKTIFTVAGNDLVKKYQINFLIRFLIWLCIFCVCLLVPTFVSMQYLPILSCMLGLIIAHGIELQHQTIHYSAFKSKKLNIIIGNILGLPILNSFSHYQYVHNWHHQHVGSAADIEFFSEHRLNSRIKLGDLLYKLISIHISYILIFKRFIFYKNTVSEKIKREFSLHVLCHLLFIFICISNVSYVVIYINWLMSLAFYHAWHFLFEFPEHYLCSHEVKSIFFNTRSIQTNSFAKYLTNFNNFHAEHHLFPKVPMVCLEAIHRQVSIKVKHKNTSYFDFYKSIFTRNLM
ncbi:MAG: fatty acid desaturase family protein [Pseudobdellovibrionaceae bacterium]